MSWQLTHLSSWGWFVCFLVTCFTRSRRVCWQMRYFCDTDYFRESVLFLNIVDKRGAAGATFIASLPGFQGSSVAEL